MGIGLVVLKHPSPSTRLVSIPRDWVELGSTPISQMKGNDSMGKKDEEISRLNAELSATRKTVDELAAKNRGLTENNQQLNDKIAKMDDKHKQVVTELQAGYQASVDTLKKEYEHLDNMKIPLDLEVDVTGCQNIPETLDAAVALMESRFEALGLGGKYNIIAHPHSMKIKLL